MKTILNWYKSCGFYTYKIQYYRKVEFSYDVILNLLNEILEILKNDSI